MRDSVKAVIKWSAVIVAIVVAATVFLSIPQAKGQPILHGNSVPLYIGCNNTPTITGQYWTGSIVILKWINAPVGTQAYTTAPIDRNDGFVAQAPHIDPVDSSYVLVVTSDMGDFQNLTFGTASLNGAACP